MHEELAAVLFDANPTPMWVFDHETLRFLVVNAAAIATYGYTRDEFLGMTLADIRPPEDVPLLHAVLARRSEGFVPVDGVFRHRRKDGHIFPVRIMAHSTVIDGRPASLIAVHDATDTEAMRARRDADAALMRLAGRMARFGGWRVSLPDGLISWSDETAAIHDEPPGYSPRVDDGIAYYAPEHRDRIRQVFAACVEDGQPYDEVLQIISATGRRVWVRTIGEAERDADGRIVAVRGAFQDISEQLAARAAADRTAQRLELMVASISDSLYTLDAQWRFTLVNPQAEHILKRQAAEILGTVVWESFPETRGTVLEAQYRQAAATGQARHFDFFYPPLEAWFDIKVYPSAEGLTVYFRDITEKKRDEGILAWQAAMLDDAQDAISVRALDHRILYWNRMAQTLYGWTADEAIGRDCRDLLGGDAVRFAEAERETRETGRWTGRLQKRCSDGRLVTVESRWTRIGARGDLPPAILVMDADITERLALEAKLGQINRLDAVGQLTGGVAHDFNNLLTVILGNAELMAEMMAEDDPMRAMVETTHVAAERGAELTRRLLAFARRQPLAPRPTDVNRLLQDLAPLARRALGEAVTLDFALEDGLPAAAIDPRELENAVLNLCVNARDAMRPMGGGRLLIETANVAADSVLHAEASGLRSGDYILLAVTDTGVGMTPEVLGRAFEPFFTTKGVGEGSGLGLSQVFGFAHQSGGHVAIASESGRGATVRLYLPATTDPSVEMSESAPSSLPRGRETVMVVEDDALVRSHAVTILRGLGYHVIAVADGPSALAVVAAGAPFDVLFTDMMMPGGIHGRDLADIVRRFRPGVCVLGTSGHVDAAASASASAAMTVLPKPYNRQQLAEALRAVIDAEAAPRRCGS